MKARNRRHGGLARKQTPGFCPLLIPPALSSSGAEPAPVGPLCSQLAKRQHPHRLRRQSSPSPSLCGPPPPPGEVLLPLHLLLQYLTSSQQRSHFFLHVNGRWQTTHSLLGRFSFFTTLVFPDLAVTRMVRVAATSDGERKASIRCGESSHAPAVPVARETCRCGTAASCS